MQSDVGNLKTSLYKVQIALGGDFTRADIESSGVAILSYTQLGRVANIIVSGDRQAGESALSALNPVILEVLPLSLEEVFTYEMKSRGYNFDDIIGEIADSNEAAAQEVVYNVKA
jgi:ABC-2 type transport system ATP-binding protein